MSIAAAVRRLRKLAPGRSRPQGYAERQARDDANIAAILDDKLHASSVCIDVGAHTGDFLDRFLARAPDGAHVAIEALPDLADALVRKYPTVRVENCALADSEGESTFFRQIDAPAWSSLAEGHAPDKGSRCESLTVPVRRLDSLVTSADFVKIDVEGAELGVLSGAGQLLLRSRPILLFEHAHIHAKHFETEPVDVWGALDGHGYDTFSLSGGDALDSASFNAVCERSRQNGYGFEAETNFLARPR